MNDILQDHRQSLTLCMIVKNESKVIKRCLLSVLPFINEYCIVDTGSTDNTVEIIAETLKHLPGEVHFRPWVNFSHNRNECLSLAKGTYLLTIDADDTLEYEAGFCLPPLITVGYYLHVKHGSLGHKQTHIIRSDVGWKCEGVTHEVLVCSRMNEIQELVGLTYKIGNDGANRPNKFKRDIELLEHELFVHPNDARAQFYLAQSYRDDRNFGAAIDAYAKRISMGGWQEEVWISYLELAKMQPSINSYLRVYEMRPIRAEPLCNLAIYLRTIGRIKQAYPFALAASSMPMPKDEVLFVDEDVYTWKSLDELTVSGYWTEQYQTALDACETLLNGCHLPSEQRPRIEDNKRHCLIKLGKIIP